MVRGGGRTKKKKRKQLRTLEKKHIKKDNENRLRENALQVTQRKGKKERKEWKKERRV